MTCKHELCGDDLCDEEITELDGYCARCFDLGLPTLYAEIARLQALNVSLTERVAAQSELLGKRAEKDS